MLKAPRSSTADWAQAITSRAAASASAAGSGRTRMAVIEVQKASLEV
jgi:hypothetical protein